MSECGPAAHILHGQRFEHVNAPYPSCQYEKFPKIEFSLIHSAEPVLISFTKSAKATVGCRLVRM